jgi:hypothetical protein
VADKPDLRIIRGAEVYDPRPNLHDVFAEHLQAQDYERQTRFQRICDWLEDTYYGPRGFLWFMGTLFPICAAAFTLGYFGVREFLAGVGL